MTITVNSQDMIRRAMDMRITDRLDRDGKDVDNPYDYLAGVMNGITSALEALAQAGLVLTIENPAPNELAAFMAREIERTSP